MVQKNNLGNKVLIICGPTASGKSDLAVECAKILDTEIISADSMYIYKHLNIGTAKPTDDEKQGIVHHMIDVVEPCGTFTVSDYKSKAEPVIEDILFKGKIPVICGGTGFYINSLLYDFSYGNGSANLAVREKYKLLAATKGNEYVYDILKDADPLSAEKLHYNDIKRVIRALEIYESGIKKSDITDDLTPKYDYKAYCVDYQRGQLYERIDARVDKMIKNGLIEEVEKLIKQGVKRDCQSMQAIGYKEIYSYLNNERSLSEAVDLIKLNTRHYAKRQITFFKKLNPIYLLPDENRKLAEIITRDFI